MATATMSNETDVANAIGVLRLAGLADNLLDKIALDSALAKSMAQADRGEKMPIKEAERIINERLASGYYDKK